MRTPALVAAAAVALLLGVVVIIPTRYLADQSAKAACNLNTCKQILWYQKCDTGTHWAYEYSDCGRCKTAGGNCDNGAVVDCVLPDVQDPIKNNRIRQQIPNTNLVCPCEGATYAEARISVPSGAWGAPFQRKICPGGGTE